MFDVGLMPGDRVDIPWTAQVPGDALRHPGRHQHVGHGQETAAPGCPAVPCSGAAGPAFQPSTGSTAVQGIADFYDPSPSSLGLLHIAHLLIVHFGKGLPWNSHSRPRRPGKHASLSNRRQPGHRLRIDRCLLSPWKGPMPFSGTSVRAGSRKALSQPAMLTLPMARRRFIPCRDGS